MGRRWAIRVGLLGLLLLGLLLPLSMLDGLVGERGARARQVAAEIADSSGRPQVLVGPVLVVDATRTLRRERIVTEQGSMRTLVDTVRESERLLLPPAALRIGGDITSERRSRGVFSALLYRAELDIEADFAPPPPPSLAGELVGYQVDAIRIGVGLGDARGIAEVLADADGVALSAEPGSALGAAGEGFHLALPAAAGVPAAVKLRLVLGGSDALRIVPLGDSTRVDLRGDWPHPAFGGEHLPQQREVGEVGYTAAWQVSRLASRSQQALARCANEPGACAALQDSALALRLVDPVDRYLMTERALKYALLFLLLVFGAVFFTEALARVAVHPMQYGLTGLALAVFYLLLLALAEHIGFGPAYALAGSACSALVATYLASALGSRARGVAFAALLAVLYGALYALLRSEDYALLLGALLLFGLLAGVMLATRRLDWSRLGA